MHLAATIERAEKQIILARHGRRLVNLLDDTPVVPGDRREPYSNSQSEQARQILTDAENDLRSWQPNLEPIPSAVGELGANLMPGRGNEAPEVAPSTEGGPVSEGQESRSSYRKEARFSSESKGMNGVEATPTAA